MKKLIKNGLLTASIIFAVSNTEAITVDLGLTVVETDLDYLKEGSKITVKDAKNKIVYSEVIETVASTNDEFQLPNLGQGYYTLEIEYDFEIVVRPFEVKTKSIEFYDARAYSIFKPVVTTKGKRLFLSRLTLNNEAFSVLVYDHKGELLFKERIQNEVEMNRVYDFSELSEDKFSVVFKSKDRTFTKNIKF